MGFLPGLHTLQFAGVWNSIDNFCIHKKDKLGSTQLNSKFNTIELWWFILPALALFVLLRQQVFLLGDGLLRIRELEQGKLFTAAEPLDSLIHSFTYKFLNPLFGIDGTDTYAYISMFCGVLAIIGLAYYINRIFVKQSHKWFLLLLIFSSGISRLFYGYVESYSILAAALLLFFISSVSMHRDNKIRIMPAVYLALSVMLHPVALVFFPALIYLYLNIKSNNKTILKIAGIALPLVLPVIMLIILSLSGISLSVYTEMVSGTGLLLPLTGEYGIFSFWHFTDILNFIFMTVPAIIILPFIIYNFNKKHFGTVEVFLLISIACGFIFLFSFKPELGFSRDWDLFAFTSIPVVIFLGLLAIKIKILRFYQLGLPVIIISLLATMPGVILNSHTEKSVAYAELLANTPYWSNNSKAMMYDELKAHFFKSGDDKKSMEYNRKAFELRPDNRYLFSLAKQEINNKEFAKAKQHLEELASTNYKTSDVQLLLGSVYYYDNEFDKAEAAFREVLNRNPEQKDAVYFLAMIYYKSAKAGLAADYFRKYIAIDPGRQDVYGFLGEIYFNNRNNSDAERCFRKQVQIAPENPVANYNLALCYADMGKFQSAMNYAKRAEKFGFDPKVIAALKAQISKRLQ